MSRLENSPEQAISLVAVGDVALTHKHNSLVQHKPKLYPFDIVKEYLNNSDIVFANLEAPLCNAYKTYPMKCSLRGDPSYAKRLKEAGFNVVSLSNNHIFDYKEKGFFQTLQVLDNYGIKYFGAGKNLAEARKPAILDKNGIKVGFLGYCDVVIDSPFYASESSRGIAPLRLSFLKEDIHKLKKAADVIIVSLHWGVENWNYPSPEQIEIAHQIVDWGCHLILGHHPHVLQGVEHYKQGYIAYSLGNFVFSDIDWSWPKADGQVGRSTVRLTKKNKEGMILSAGLTKNGVEKVELIPSFIANDYQIDILRDRAKFQRTMSVLSKRFKSRNYVTFWKLYSLWKRLGGALQTNIPRLKRIHKLRLSHIREAANFIRSL